jgi:dihydroorotase
LSVSERILFRGARVIDPASNTDAVLDVLLDGGTVRTIATTIDPADARVIDFDGKLLVPGLVDIHTHLREPGFEHKGTITTETRAALRGGFTTLCAMPNTEPAPDNASTVESLLERIQRDAAVRVFPIGCITRGRAGKQLAELSELADAGCIALSDDGNPVADPRLFRNALAIAASLGLPISEHSDDPSLSAGGVAHEGRISERLGLRGYPAAAETNAIARNIELAAVSGARLHLAHLSCERSVELVAAAKARGLAVTCEVTPSHLLLTEDAIAGPGRQPLYDTNARINPPLRTERDRQALLAGVNSGVIDAIATDHAPHAVPDKQCEFDHAAPGISCLETAIGSVLTLVSRGELDLGRAIAALTAGPARCFALEKRAPGIGSLRPGLATDLVVLDPSATWRVDPTTFASRGRNTPLAGTELTGRAASVYTRGQLHELAMPVHA